MLEFDDLIEFFERLPNPDKQFAWWPASRTLPSDQLPDGVSHLACVSLAAGAGLPRIGCARHCCALTWRKHRFRDRPQMLDEEPNHRADGSILQRDDRN